MRTSYRTLAAPVRVEIAAVKGSRFLGCAAPAADEAGAAAFLASLRAELRDATHLCSAWRLGPDGARFRSSDDGEPGGSAGRPILAQLEGRELTNAAVVVARWFGGTKLGVGGLVRAYAAAAARALDAATIRTVPITRRLVVEHAWAQSGAVRAWLARRGLEPTDAAYGGTVRLTLEVPLAELEAFERELADRTGGRARVVEASSTAAQDSDSKRISQKKR